MTKAEHINTPTSPWNKAPMHGEDLVVLPKWKFQEIVNAAKLIERQAAEKEFAKLTEPGEPPPRTLLTTKPRVLRRAS